MLINNVTKYPDSLIIFAILGEGSILRLVLLVVRRSFLIKHWWGVGRLMPQQTLLPSSLAKSGFSSSENHSPLEGMVLSWCCKKGDPFWGLRVGSCLTLKNELSKETHVLTKQEILLGRGAQAEQEGKWTQENISATWPLSFMVMGLVSGLSLASYYDSVFFLVAHGLLSQDGFQ